MINSLRRRRRIRKLSEVSLTPLIDVALTLLVAIMIAMPVTQNAIKIALPQGTVNECNSWGVKGSIHKPLILEELEKMVNGIFEG